MARLTFILGARILQSIEAALAKGGLPIWRQRASILMRPIVAFRCGDFAMNEFGHLSSFVIVALPLVAVAIAAASLAFSRNSKA